MLRRLHFAWVTVLFACTAPPPAPPSGLLAVGAEVGWHDWHEDLVSPARLRLSVVLLGPGHAVHELECDFDWNAPMDDERWYVDMCRGDVGFEVILRCSNSNLSGCRMSMSLFMTVPERATQILFFGEYEPPEKPSFRELGTITWPSEAPGAHGEISWR
ncbi:MAG: hypothetical protein KC431_17235 [Myxococcales bacterium]|nr:hypothetical protein [Myxococcales bacterium]